MNIRTFNASDTITDRITITGGVGTARVTILNSEFYVGGTEVPDWVFEEYYGKGMELTRG